MVYVEVKHYQPNKDRIDNNYVTHEKEKHKSFLLDVIGPTNINEHCIYKSLQNSLELSSSQRAILFRTPLIPQRLMPSLQTAFSHSH